MTTQSLAMGALCWVLPLEEDGDTLEEDGDTLEEEEDGEGKLLVETACCLSRHRAPDGVARLVNMADLQLLVRLWIRYFYFCYIKLRKEGLVQGPGSGNSAGDPNKVELNSLRLRGPARSTCDQVHL